MTASCRQNLNKCNGEDYMLLKMKSSGVSQIEIGPE